MNRKARRLMKNNAEKLADQMLTAVYDYTPDGRRFDRVSAPDAIAALRRAFILMLKGGGEPLAVLLKPETARQFPRGNVEIPEGYGSYLAVGLDKDGRGSYSIRTLYAPGLPRVIADGVGRHEALQSLAKVTAYGGFPVGETKGAC